MKISFENPDKVNGLLTITVEEADYQASVEKTLKDYRKKANYPGFRPGMVPMGLIKKQYGASAKMDAINKLIGEQIYKYMQDNKIQMLGEPLPSEKQEAQDLEKPAPYTFAFDIAVAPEFKIELNGHNKIDHYTIIVDDALIDRQVEMFTSRNGTYEKAESYEDNDMLKGDLRELDEKGNTKEDGITVEAASILPNYIKDEAQKALFNGAKLGDIITLNVSKAFESEAEIASLLKVERDRVKDIKSDFSYQITDIQRYKKHPVDQELFDSLFGKDTVKSEKEFREKIAEGLKEQLAVDADYKFILDVRAYCEKKVGKLEFPDALLKRIMLNNNKDKGEEFVEKNYEQSIKELTWHLIKEQLVADNQIKVNDEDVLNAAKETARVQFAQYGMNNVPDEYVENYAKEILKKRENVDGLVDRAVDIKLTDALKKVVKLNEKEISLDDFNKMMSE
ncbi:MAG: trigger factor [Prevotella salivae]|jgi:trigger factor|uniref:trigger factor n=1 Tax=Prevotellaceae TaxID=171552 RepID=UPI001CB0B058|nr:MULTISPECIES: trigger factor [Prevotellaceae]MBF1531036.1 trigger factor [Segatella salivae]MBF1532346.1 trigger factor [Segatella salivae]MBF1539986.1 trigger factor [Segatella salivae]MBF1557751.1 trigger factor [Segatella salivae]MBF1565979.1 trigger factor [Segatella salivae]